MTSQSQRGLLGYAHNQMDELGYLKCRQDRKEIEMLSFDELGLVRIES